MKPFDALRMRNAAPSAPGDPYWNNVVLLIGANGVNGSTAIVDESPVGRALTLGGNAQISTTNPKFGTGCMLFDGTGDNITAADSEDFNFGASNWTLECWVNFATVTNCHFINQGSNACGMFFVNGDRLHMTFNGVPGVLQETGVWAPTPGQWYHLVAERSGSALRLYRDGTMVGKVTGITTVEANDAGVLAVGSSPFSTDYINGRMDDVRVTYGIARYDSDSGYAVPTAAFPRTAAANAGLYRYYKFALSSSNNGSNIFLITEMDVAESNGGADVSQRGRVTGTAGAFSSAEGPDKAINGNTGDWWQTQSAGTVEIILDFFSKRTLHEVTFTPHASFLDRTPQQVIVSGSNDGVSYTPLHTFSGLTGWVGARTLQW